MTEQVFTNEAGEAIPEDQLAAAFEAGEAFGDAAADYRMRDETGAIVKVKGAEVPNALAAGASLLSPSESGFEDRRKDYIGTGAALRTAAERGVSTATGGLSDLAVGLASPEAARGMRERAQVQDSAGAMGGALGMAVPLSIGGKLAKPLGKIASLVKPTTPVGRMALRAASEAAPYALEGALYGGTSTAGNLALNGQEITAEKVLSGAGQGALLGGLFGLGSQAAALGARKIAGKLDDLAEGFKRGLGKGEGRAIDALRPSQRLIKQKVGRDASKIESALDDVNRDYLGYTIKTGPMKGKQIHHGARDPVDVIDDVTHAWNETGREIQRFRDAADEVGQVTPAARPDSVSLNKKLDEVVSEVAGDEFAGAAQKRLAKRIERDHLKPLREWRDRGAADPIEQLQALGVENTKFNRDPGSMKPASAEKTRAAFEGTTPEQAQAIATGNAPAVDSGKKLPPVEVHVYPDTLAMNDGRHRLAAATAAGAEDIAAHVRVYDAEANLLREWTGPISIKGRPVTPDGAPSLSQLDRMRQSVGDALSAAKRAGKKDEIRAYGKVYSAITGSIDDTIEKTLAPQGVNLAEYKELKRVYSSLSFAKQAIDDLKFASAVKGKEPTSADNAGIAFAFAQALTGNFGNAAASLGRAVLGDSVAGVLSGRAANTTTALQLGAKALATGSRAVAKAAPYAPSAAVRYMMRAEPQVVFDRLRETTADPQRLQQYAASRVQDFAQQYPDLAVQAQQAVVGDLQHLAQTAPQGFTRHSAAMTPMSKEARERLYSHPDVRKWLERAEALENPASVVNAMLSGRVPYAAIETLKLRRPQIWNELRQEVATEIAQQPKAVPFRRRIMLGSAFEFPADYSMLPDVAAELQAPPITEEQGQPQGMTKAATPDTSAMMTSTDRLEERM